MNSVESTCVFASELDEKARGSYFANYGIYPEGDITNIDEKDIPEHDLICAGFPCQAFSIAGKKQGFSTTKGTLFFDIVRIALHHSPKAMLLENVKNFASHDKGNTLRIVLSSLNTLGYDVHYKVLNSSYFGVPQKRERIFIVAFRKDLGVKRFRFPTRKGRPVPLQSILMLEEHIDPSLYLDTSRQVTYTPKLIQKGHNGLYPALPIRIGTLGKGRQGERIYSPLGHSITLSASGGGLGRTTGLYLINERIRRLAPRECARLMGFPEDFALFIHAKPEIYKQLGNSVVVNVVQAVIQKMKGYL